MPILAGADGCKTGWLCVVKDFDTGLVTSGVYNNAQSLIQQEPKPSIIAVDIPIGLTEAGPRQCDIEARKLLGFPRQSSVFTAPLRPALKARTREQADSIRRTVEGLGVSAQSFGIYSKIFEFDEILSLQPLLQERVKEIHPEVCFWAWNNQQPMTYKKKSKEGKAERRNLIVEYFGAEAVKEIRTKYLAKHVGDDDIYDAFAALWTTERIFNGKASVIPDPPPYDTAGLRTEIWY